MISFDALGPDSLASKQTGVHILPSLGNIDWLRNADVQVVDSMGLSGGRLSDAQISALVDAANGRLCRYRRGYALTRFGPFHGNRTVKALERHGLLSVTGALPKAKLTANGRRALDELNGAGDVVGLPGHPEPL